MLEKFQLSFYYGLFYPMSNSDNPVLLLLKIRMNYHRLYAPEAPMLAKIFEYA